MFYHERVETALEKYIDGEMGELPFALREIKGNAIKPVVRSFVR